MQIAFYTQNDHLFREIDKAFEEDGNYRCIRFTSELPLIRFLERHDTALVLFDFDEFKLINDLHGHPAGDAVLRAVAEAAQGVVRRDDRLARIGGDEFAVLAAGAGPEGVMRLVDALDQAIRSADTPGRVGAVRATFAWATAPQDATDPEGLIQHADARLIQRKRDLKAANATRHLVATS